MAGCECDWEYHQGSPCPQDAADHGSVTSSPALCTWCLFVCCEERDTTEGIVRGRE